MTDPVPLVQVKDNFTFSDFLWSMFCDTSVAQGHELRGESLLSDKYLQQLQFCFSRNFHAFYSSNVRDNLKPIPLMVNHNSIPPQLCLLISLLFFHHSTLPLNWPYFSNPSDVKEVLNPQTLGFLGHYPNILGLYPKIIELFVGKILDICGWLRCHLQHAGLWKIVFHWNCKPCEKFKSKIVPMEKLGIGLGLTIRGIDCKCLQM